MDTIQAMRMFVMVVQNGSLSAAGRQIGMSPASISRYINALEDRTGSRLLNRSSRKLTLTEAGAIYAQYAERILAQLDEVNSSISQLQRSPKGTLRVHSRIFIANELIVPAMPRFLAMYPELKVDLMMSNNVVDLVEQNVDVDVRIGALQDSSLVVRKLLSSERVLCAAPSYLQSHDPIERPEDLQKHNCLTYRINLGRTIWRFASPDGTITEVPVDGSFQTDHGPSLRSVALAGAGVILMPDWSVRDELRQGTLAPLLPGYRVSYASFENGVYAVYQQTRRMSAKVRIFVDFLAALIKERYG